VVKVDEGLAPPAKLLRFVPEEYEDQAEPHTSEGMMRRWLEDRAAWRACSGVPLPGLPARARAQLWRLEVPARLLEAEKDAPRPPPYRNEAS